MAIEHFGHYFYGAHFIVVTDHQTLVCLLPLDTSIIDFGIGLFISKNGISIYVTTLGKSKEMLMLCPDKHGQARRTFVIPLGITHCKGEMWECSPTIWNETEQRLYFSCHPSHLPDPSVVQICIYPAHLPNPTIVHHPTIAADLSVTFPPSSICFCGSGKVPI